METTLSNEQYAEAYERLKSIDWHGISVAFRQVIDSIVDAWKALVEWCKKVVPIIIKTFRDAIYSQSPPNVVHLARYHKQKKIRSKNWTRIISIWRKRI